MTACGLWLARRRLVAAVLGAHARPVRTVRAALSDDARFGLAEFLVGADCELVVTESLARADPLPAQAARRGLAVWVADDQLVAGLLGVAAVRDPARAAALLARMRLVPTWRGHLRRLTPAAPARQLTLL